MRTFVVIILVLLTANTAAAAPAFVKKHRTVVNAIIWAADKAEVPRELVLAICWNESNFRLKGVTHIDGDTLSHSICQVKLETARWMDRRWGHKIEATPERLENPYINAFYAAKLLKHQLSRYNDNWPLAIDAYNKGTAVSKESKYVKKCFKALKHIQKHIDAAILDFRPVKL